MNQRIRTVIFWLHLAAGLTAGAVILVMSVTGTLLMYEHQILDWADRGYRVAPPAPGAARLPADVLLARVVAAQPGASPSSLTIQSDPLEPAQVSLGRERVVYADPYTGAVLGEGSRAVRSFFRKVTDWHRWLGAGEERRGLARKVTGACNLAFLVLIVSGLYLWLPRQWTWRRVRNVLWFRRGLSGKARDFNWHNTLGLWSWVPLFLIVVSAVFISYPAAGDLLLRLLGEEPPPARGEGRGPGGGRPGGETAAVALDGLGPLWTRAEQQVPGWKSISLRLPGDPAAPVTFSISSGGRGRPDLRAQLTLDRASGAVETWNPYAEQSFGRRLRSWMRWIHTGEAGGLLGQTLAGLASAGAAVLVWTGVALAWRRFFPRRRQRPAEQPETESSAPERAASA